jgi:hypothetical protein
MESDTAYLTSDEIFPSSCNAIIVSSLPLYLPTVCARNRGLHTQSWEFTKNFRPEPICRHGFVFPGTHFLLYKGHNPWLIKSL